MRSEHCSFGTVANAARHFGFPGDRMRVNCAQLRDHAGNARDGGDRHRLADRNPARAGIMAGEPGEILHLSPSQAARRRSRLKAGGVIASYRARLDPGRPGLTVQAIVRVQMTAHNADSPANFVRLVVTLPKAVGCWTLTGEADCLLRVWVADLAALTTFNHQRLLAHPAVARVQSRIVMDQPKANAGLPV